jgi:hypothetical protein
MEDPADDTPKKDVYTSAKPSKFHFKSSSSRRKRHHDRSDSDKERSHRSSKRHRSDSHRQHHHSPRSKPSSRHPTATVDGEYYDPDHRYRESLFDQVEENNADVFRESLFDALADDEGAAYWEGVYGQPIHTYPAEKPGPDGKLERMTEDEYAEYVRAKMWEKSHQHIVEEREAKAKARRNQKERRRRQEDGFEAEEREREGIRRQMEESLRRGEERKKAKEAAKGWEIYEAKWTKLNSTLNPPALEPEKVAQLIPWPVLSGRVEDVDEAAIESFLRAAPGWMADKSGLLKAERVRWHPDKMQRRFGQKIGEEVMRGVTAVFQVVDRMWSARR